LLHDRPADQWTLEKLAREVHISRATLTRRFTGAVGTPPLAYLSSWRMHLAAQRLKHTTETVESIAREVGYSSEYAFNRAFSWTCSRRADPAPPAEPSVSGRASLNQPGFF
jgi:AraC-like DNA-binding protein